MANIHVLDQGTINQIAAGEVVERPASIVKELVENAVDARSTAVTIEIKGGGIDFIRITDNGTGIPKDQVRKAFLRHATSKIESAEDLTTVSSLGFRGEALSSICAVAKVELITKTDEGISGVRYIIEGSEEISSEEIGCPEGTTFVVRNLFYNTPARRKFLKSGMTEAGYVEAFVQRLALSYPDIAFKFISDNRNKMSTPGNGNLKDVIYHIFGRDIARNLLPADHEEAGIRIRGYVGKPLISRGNRNYEFYYVNGRYLKNNIIARAIEDGYKGHNMVHKFPFTVLMIEMDPLLFDVNVHPAKMEMRFKNAEELYSAVAGAVRGSFDGKDLITRTSPGKDVRDKAPGPKDGPEPFEKKRREGAEGTPLPEPEEKSISARIQEKIERLQLNQVPLPEEESVLRKEMPGLMSVREPAPAYGLRKSENGPASPAAEIAAGHAAAPARSGVSGPGVVRTPEGKQMSLRDIPFLSEEARPRHRLIGQAFLTYWIVEYEDKLFFVVQHAAHEKVMYEKLKKAMEDKTINTQMVAPPIVIHFNIKEKNKYIRCQDAFAALGYQIEEFGEDAWCIRGVPDNLYGLDQQELFVELLDQIEEGSSQPDLSVITDRLASMACKAAVKGNQRLSEKEMDSLMDQLLKLDNPYQCPHGRPTIIAMTRYEIEKKFKRIQT